MLGDLGSQFDFVILDCPPVLTATDARILGAMCDMTLFVVRSAYSSKRNATDARDGLLGFGANLLGLVVNDSTPDHRQSPLGGRGGRFTPSRHTGQNSDGRSSLAFSPKR